MTATPTATYTERYIAAVTRAVPPASRGDVADELAASIADAVAARIDNGQPAASAERDVLTEMGDPGKLAADYADRPLTLIGPRYFLDWWRLLKLLLWIVLPIIVVVSVAVQYFAGEGVGAIIGRTIGLTISVATQIGFWVTFGFAALEWAQPKGKSPMPTWTIDQLPELRRPGVGFSDMIASLVFLGLAVVALFWDRFLGFVPGQGEVVPILDPALWPWGIVAVLVAAVAEGALAVAVYRRGRWTVAFAVVNSILAVVFTIAVVWLLVNGMLVNPEFVEVVADTPVIAPAAVTAMSVAFALVAAWDIADGWYKVFRDRRA